MSFLGPSWKGLIHLSWVLTLINQAWQKSFPPRKKMFETFMKQKSRIFYLGHPISSAFFCCWPHHQLWPACSSTPRCLEAVYLWKSDDRYLPLKAISSMAGRCSSSCYRCMLACQCAFIGGQHFIIIVQWHLEDGKQSITYGFWLMTNRPFSAAKGHRGAKLSLHSSSLPLLLSSIYVHEVVRDGLGAQLASENRTATSSSKQRESSTYSR